MLDAFVTVSAARSTAMTAAGIPVPGLQQIRALLDTGASCTCLDPTVIAALGISPTGVEKCMIHYNGPMSVLIVSY